MLDLRVSGWLLLLVTSSYLLITFPTAAGQDGMRTCYNFTWVGTNESINCEDHVVDRLGEAQPCIYPVIHTDNSNPPNLTQLDLYCATHSCHHTCKVKGSQCIRWNWYNIDNKLTNYSLFCGTVSDVTSEENPKSEKNNCWMSMVGTYMKEVCVCDGDKCNGGGKTAAGILTLILPLLLSCIYTF